MDPRNLPVKIEITKAINGTELDGRLRNVQLKGFPNVNVYSDADIEIKEFSPEQIRERLFTPQPRVYRTFLTAIMQMHEMFKEQGIDMFRLSGGYDYTATYDNGEKSKWTLIPPVVEVVPIYFTGKGLDYGIGIGERLREEMQRQGHKLNPELEEFDFPEFQRFRLGKNDVFELCDGSHRVHAALEQRINQYLLVIDHAHLDYPYYAAPKPYSVVHVEADRIDGSKSDKTHVLTEPGHKLLYRLFPSGGIHNGDVRPD